MLHDLRYVLRQALARPALAGLVVGVLALGIGAATAIFSLTDAVLFRSLPIHAPERVVRVFRVDEHGMPQMNLAFPNFVDLRDGMSSFSHVAAYQDWSPFNLAGAGLEPARVAGAVVTGEYFNLFGVPPLLGRTLLPADDGERGAHAVVVLGERLWRSRFGADPGILGRSITINTYPFTVVGVMPAAFGGASAQPTVDAWVPMAMLEQAAPMERWEFLGNRGASWLDGIARLAPGVSLAAAQAEVDAVAARAVEAEGLEPGQLRLGLIAATRAAIDPYGYESTRRNALLLLGVTLVLLSIAMINAAGLLLVRAEERAREIALRMGIGAARGRVLRMLLVEAFVYALAGAVMGTLLAWFVLAAMLEPLAGMMSGAPTDPSLLLRGRVLGFAVALAAATALIAVVSPALRVLRLDVNTTLKQGGARTARQGGRARSAAVVGQVMLSVSLLAVALLLVRSFWHTVAVDPGFDPRHTLTASVDLLRQGYSAEQAVQAQEAIIERLNAHPDVAAAAFARIVPVQGGSMRSSFRRAGIEPEGHMQTDVNFVSPEYFEALRIPVLQGRALSAWDREGAARAVVINRALAERWFPGEDAIGQELEIEGAGLLWRIVGIVADSKLRSLRESPQPSAYFPLAQRRDAQASLIVRGHGDDPWRLLPAIREAMHAVDPTLPLFRTRTLAEHVARSHIEATVMAWLLSSIAALAVLLSAAG
ncbi:MAG TPA: ADOP family duplicated permease, partial [Xanthomonadaceae bacterium]|nr:ADOP family duplicated permease [Xanthomonadaceae bacterium]